MKKITIKIATMSILFLTFISANAQTTVTAIAGLHSSTTTTSGDVSNILNIAPLKSINYGILVEHPLDDRLSVTTGISSKKKGFELQESFGMEVAGIPIPLGVKVVNSINYVEIPALLKYRFESSAKVVPYIGAGPSIAYATSGSIDTKATAIFDFNVSSTPLDLSSKNYNRTEVLGNIVAGVKLPYGRSGHWIAEVNYSKGFTDFVSDDFLIDAGGKHDGWTFNVGYGINF